MARRLIDADKLKSYIRINFSQSMRQKSVLTSIDEQPVIDAKEVEHGEWRENKEELDWDILSTVECSICGDVQILDRPLKKFEHLHRYCPNCGAKMDGGPKDAIN